MSREKPNAYTAEFRASAVKLANESDKSVTQVAQDLGVNVNTLHTWIGKYSRCQSPDNPIRTDDHLYDELKRLKKEVARLTEERDIVKKAAACFAKEQRYSTPGFKSIRRNSVWLRCVGLCKCHQAPIMPDSIAVLRHGSERMSN